MSDGEHGTSDVDRFGVDPEELEGLTVVDAADLNRPASSQTSEVDDARFEQQQAALRERYQALIDQGVDPVKARQQALSEDEQDRHAA